LLLASAARAEDKPQIQIVNPHGDKTYRAAIQHFATRDARAEQLGAQIHAAIQQGLQFSGLFSVVNERAFLESTKSPFLDGAPDVNCPNWKQIDADALVQGEVESGGEGVRATFRLTDVTRCQALVRGKRFTGKNELRFADLKRIGRLQGEERKAFDAKYGPRLEAAMRKLMDGATACMSNPKVSDALKKIR